MSAHPTTELTPKAVLAMAAENERRQPGFFRAAGEDARRAARQRGERAPSTRLATILTIVRLMWGGDDFAGVVLYRLRTSLRRTHVPLLPRMLDRACSVLFNLRISDEVVIGEGVYIPHGNAVISGITVIGRRAYIAPWVSIGLKQGNFVGPTIGEAVFVGTGASILGPLQIGDGAQIAAGAVVVTDVPAGAAVGGVPAKVLSRSGDEGEL